MAFCPCASQLAAARSAPPGPLGGASMNVPVSLHPFPLFVNFLLNSRLPKDFIPSCSLLASTFDSLIIPPSLSPCIPPTVQRHFWWVFVCPPSHFPFLLFSSRLLQIVLQSLHVAPELGWLSQVHVLTDPLDVVFIPDKDGVGVRPAFVW